VPALPEWLVVRGEIASMLIVVVTLALATRPLSNLLAVPRMGLSDLLWSGGVAFVVVGRIAYVAIESPEALTDPFVLLRFQGGIEPLAGLAAVAGVLAWRTRRDRASLVMWLAAASAGILVALVSYDAACIARDACAGAEAPAPLGFTMAGLSDTRLATPLIEAALLLLAAGALLTAPLDARRAALALAGFAALLRAALTPLSILGPDALGPETAAFVALGVALLILAARLVPAPVEDFRSAQATSDV
jgi:hypothetical protein